jgi:tricorn protease
MPIPCTLCASFAAFVFSTAISMAQQAAAPLSPRLMQMPAVSSTQIAFVFAGDIWIAPRSGGQAVRLSSPRGTEQFPRFSPDGRQLAFSANYEGNMDIYVMPATGGEPLRVTHHGAADRLLGWYPDGQHLLVQNESVSWTPRVGQFFKVPAVGGLPEKLPVPYGEFAAVSPDGSTLAFTQITTDFATWKRYRGGMAPELWLMKLDSLAVEKIAPSPAKDSQPMWHGSKVYFLSDRDEASRDNLWVYDTATRVVRQVTHFREFDIHFPSIGPDAIIFVNGGRLYLLDLATEKTSEVHISVVTDRATVRPKVENVSGLVRSGAAGPTGKRALFEARGDIFSVPAEHGVVRNLTASSSVAERFPAWSPDNRWIAYFSDRTGEYELTLRTADGGLEEKTLTQLGPGFRYQPHWSPDGKKIAYIDSAMRIHLTEIDGPRTEVIDRQLWLYEEGLRNFRVAWSADSRWLAYAGDQENRQTAIILYDVQERRKHQVTSGFFDDDMPVFDPDGRYLYFRSNRWFDAFYGDRDTTWIYTNGHALVAVPLKKDAPSPLAPRNDEEAAPGEKKPEEKKPDDKPAEEKPAPARPEEPPKPSEATAIDKAKPDDSKPADAKPGEARPQAPQEKRPKPVAIDIEGFEARAVVLPPGGGRFDHLAAVPGKLLFQKRPRVGASGGASPIAFYDIEKREEKTIIDDAGAYEVTADGKKLLVVRGGSWGFIHLAENQKLDKPLATGQLEALVEPREEWRQIFRDAWRIQRDFFYDPGLHGVDWPLMRERYGPLIDECQTRDDVNFVIGELLGELSVSHAYRSGGDVESAPSRSVGCLGCDFALEQGAYRIAAIPEVAPWEYTIRSPLRAPGVNIAVGDWILAVNGLPIDVTRDPWAAFQGLAGKPVFLTVNDKPLFDGARQVLVQTIPSERWLRHYAWIEANRQKVEALSGGQLGYIYVMDTSTEGQAQLFRQFRAQFTKPGLVIDARWNSGGQIPDRFVELLARRVTNFWGVRDGRDWQTPTVAHRGPKAILANAWSGSGGDCLPWLFREHGLGPVIGTRTWGGLIGMTGAPPLIDGGSVTVPTFAIYDTDGKWIIEGHGVDPDIEVIDDPGELARGRDPQLERAVAEVMRALKKSPPIAPRRPEFPKRIPASASPAAPAGSAPAASPATATPAGR